MYRWLTPASVSPSHLKTHSAGLTGVSVVNSCLILVFTVSHVKVKVRMSKQPLPTGASRKGLNNIKYSVDHIKVFKVGLEYSPSKNRFRSQLTWLHSLLKSTPRQNHQPVVWSLTLEKNISSPVNISCLRVEYTHFRKKWKLRSLHGSLRSGPAGWIYKNNIWKCPGMEECPSRICRITWENNLLEHFTTHPLHAIQIRISKYLLRVCRHNETLEQRGIITTTIPIQITIK